MNKSQLLELVNKRDDFAWRNPYRFESCPDYKSCMYAKGPGKLHLLPF